MTKSPSKRVFVTGSDGFVGGHLVKALRGSGHEVFSDLIDINNVRAVEEYVSAHEPFDIVFNLAGISSVSECAKSPMLAYKTNGLSAGVLFEELAKKSDKTKFVFFSTAQVYDFSKLQEDQAIAEDFPIGPHNIYGRSKLCGEMILQDLSFAKNYPNQILILRLFNHVHKSQSPAFFLPSVYQQLLKVQRGEADSITVGNLDLWRDFSTVRTLVQNLTRLVEGMSSTGRHEVLNVGSGFAFKLDAIVKALMVQLKVECNVHSKPELYRSLDPKRILCNTAKQNLFFPKKGTQEWGLSQLVEAFLDDMP